MNTSTTFNTDPEILKTLNPNPSIMTLNLAHKTLNSKPQTTNSKPYKPKP